MVRTLESLKARIKPYFEEHHGEDVDYVDLMEYLPDVSLYMIVAACEELALEGKIVGAGDKIGIPTSSTAILEMAKQANLSDVLVLGYLPDGSFYAVSSSNDRDWCYRTAFLAAHFYSPTKEDTNEETE